MPPLKEKRILLGVTGSIAAYKAVELASRLTQAGALVDTILTQAATRFVAPLTFQSVTARQAYADQDLWNGQEHVLHVKLAEWADIIVIAPATANTIAKLAHGLAEDLLSLTALSFTSSPPRIITPSFLIAPAMDAGLWKNPAIQKNVATLKKQGALTIGPEQGHLASGLDAAGRMSEPENIFREIRYQLSRRGPLAGKKFVVTAGPTQEPIDPVRFLGNPSSGKQGFAVAQAALDQGAQVTLIAGPTALAAPRGAEKIDVQTAEEMTNAVLSNCPRADALVMTAAVADFKPAKSYAQKLKKENGLTGINLKRTQDILTQVGRLKKKTGWPKIVVGFAAETENLIANAQDKLNKKALNLIVANNIAQPGRGFQSDTNQAILLAPGSVPKTLPLMTKEKTAVEILARITLLLKN
ncbi:MAG: bifunctional phosphopantothenoylcysteine decarboxylase/phosphopantothenate--cysteine ligase CoaBC [Elusimicrobia bacterium]|nr:bifunctional phosphopantothenoylcysteine decarboxylase/phosphopantothenate--cysteine ligase CoaBC [Elusimicrobiota bacterium]